MIRVREIAEGTSMSVSIGPGSSNRSGPGWAQLADLALSGAIAGVAFAVLFPDGRSVFHGGRPSAMQVLVYAAGTSLGSVIANSVMRPLSGPLRLLSVPVVLGASTATAIAMLDGMILGSVVPILMLIALGMMGVSSGAALANRYLGGRTRLTAMVVAPLGCALFTVLLSLARRGDLSLADFSAGGLLAPVLGTSILGLGTCPSVLDSDPDRGAG